MRIQILAVMLSLALVPRSDAATDPVGKSEVATTPAQPIAAQPLSSPAVLLADTRDRDEFRPMYESSSNPALVDSPGAALETAVYADGDGDGSGGGKAKSQVETKAFSAIAFRLKFGSGGFGMDIATPLAKRLNLRVGGSFFTANPEFTIDGIDILGGIEFRSVTGSIDIYPFNGSFRLSPGIYFYNDNHIGANAQVPGGQTFSLNDFTFTSSPTDPVTGSFEMQYGNRVAPTFTLGFGNMIPRTGGHWGFSSEIGVGYVGSPSVALNLGGTACYQGVCGKFSNDPTLQKDLKDEQTNLYNDFSSSHGIFPLLSTGVSYSFNIPGRR